MKPISRRHMIKGLVKSMDILTDFSFQIVLLGTVVLAMASGVVGTVTVLRGQSLIGDAIGHATFAGIVIAFMLFQAKNTLVLPWVLWLRVWWPSTLSS